MNALKINRPSLNVYSFAPKQLVTKPALCDEAQNYLRQLWDFCSAMGMRDPIDGLDLAITLPDRLASPDTSFRVIAAKIDAQRLAYQSHFQAFIFEYQDVVGMIATLEAASEGEQLSRWQDILNEWMSYVKMSPLPEGLLNEFYVFGALVSDNLFVNEDSLVSQEQFIKETGERLGKLVNEALSPSPKEAWRSTAFYLTNSYNYLWELCQLQNRRAIALFAPAANEDSNFRWAIWAGHEQLAPLARYLMHAAKLDFSLRTFNDEIAPLRNHQQSVEHALENISRLYQCSAKEELTHTTELIKAQRELALAQVSNFALYHSLSRLIDMKLTVGIAEKNMLGACPAQHPKYMPSDHSLFSQDLTKAKWLQEQIEIDLNYLEHMRERVAEENRLSSMLLNDLSQKNARSLNDLMLLQTTLIGGLIVGLSAIQSFQLRLPVREQLHWPLAFFFVALVMVLPPLFAHWRESYTRIDQVLSGFLGMTFSWLVVTAWPFYLTAYAVSMENYYVYECLMLASGFLTGCALVSCLNRIKGEPP